MTEKEKNSKAPPKSFMTAGPTLHYSHENVIKCWLLALLAYAMTCLFWSKILTGYVWAFQTEKILNPQLWRLGNEIITGISIFQYPWQILVLALTIAALAITPILISQLMSFKYSLLFLIMTVFVANLPGLAAALLISCIAVASRPLRFRSRFISVALCTAPVLIYWAFFGAASNVEPIKRGFTLLPWISAWLIALAISGYVLAIGHFTRYKPGLVWISTTLTLIVAITVFEITIGIAELDYQLYIAKNNPQKIPQFHDHSITEALDNTIANPAVRKYLAGFFYPTEMIPLRATLKNEIKNKLSQDRWPNWFILPKQLDYNSKRQKLLTQYNKFINKRPTSKRMPIALYYKAILTEYDLDINALEQKEVLHFYSDYPHDRARDIWYRLYTDFGNSPESLEARWRISVHWAGQQKFEIADKLLQQAQQRSKQLLQNHQTPKPQTDSLFSPFTPPSDTAMTEFKIKELLVKIEKLRKLISRENHLDKPEYKSKLAYFVMLNPHSLRFNNQIERLIAQTQPKEPLLDNILLAKAKNIQDMQFKAQQLKKIHETFKGSDAATEALYELARLRIQAWRQAEDQPPQQKKLLLLEARKILNTFENLYPKSIFAEKTTQYLADLPTVD